MVNEPTINITEVVRPAPAAVPNKVTKATKAVPAEKRIRILLEENDEIPPTGLFLAVNGTGYVLRAGEEADVPEFLLDILNHAEVSTPRTEGDRVVGYKTRSRFPYRIIK